MNIGEDSGREIRKDRKMILREERLKKEKLVEVQKTGTDSSSCYNLKLGSDCSLGKDLSKSGK